MSRRQFLKTSGQAAMAAASPKTALKGLAKAASPIAAIPKTPASMKAALLKWIKDNNFEPYWRSLARKEELGRHTEAQYNADMAKRKAAGKAYLKISFEDYIKKREDDYVDTFKEDILSWAEPAYDEPAYLEDLDHILDNGADDRITKGIPLPEWVTRFRVSQFMGRDVGMNHPFVKDREAWHEHFASGVWGKPDPVTEKEFDNIIRSSMSPERYKEFYQYENEPKVETGDEDEGFTQADYDKAMKDKKEFEGPEYNSGNWSSQSVEFENKLQRLL